MNKEEKLAIISRTTTAVVYGETEQYTADLGWREDGTVEVIDYDGPDNWADSIGEIGKIITDRLLNAEADDIDEYPDADEVWTHTMDIEDIKVNGFSCYAIAHFHFREENFLK